MMRSLHFSVEINEYGVQISFVKVPSTSIYKFVKTFYSALVVFSSLISSCINNAIQVISLYIGATESTIIIFTYPSLLKNIHKHRSCSPDK